MVVHKIKLLVFLLKYKMLTDGMNTIMRCTFTQIWISWKLKIL